MSWREENASGQELPKEQEMVQSLGKKIKYFREQKPYTQSELAERLAVTRQTVSSWERDRTLPDVYMLQQIAALYGMTLDEFMEGTKEAEVTMPKTPGRLLAATGAVIFGYLVAGGMTGHLYVDCVVIMVIIGVFIQLFLHLFFSGSVKTGNFSMLAGYDGKVEYNLDPRRKEIRESGRSEKSADSDGCSYWLYFFRNHIVVWNLRISGRKQMGTDRDHSDFCLLCGSVRGTGILQLPQYRQNTGKRAGQTYYKGGILFCCLFSCTGAGLCGCYFCKNRAAQYAE